MYEIRNILIPDPMKINNIKPIDRKLLDIREELIMDDRKEIDDIIYGALELTPEKQELIKQSYINLVLKRTNKSKKTTTS